jgi:Amt family ammonium transporter
MRISKFTGSVSLALVLLLAFAGAALAQDTPDASAVAASAADTALGLNVMWVLLAGFLVFFMQAGFALVETGFTRAKNVAHTMMMNMMVFCIGAIGYWLVGFALQFGGVNHTYPDVNNMGAWAFSPVTLGDWSGLLATPLVIAEQWGIAGMSGFMLMGLTANAGVLCLLPLPDGVHGHRGHHPHRFDGRAPELQGIHSDGPVREHVHLSAHGHVGLGRRLARQPWPYDGLGQRRSGLRRLGRGAHGRRRHRAGGRHDHRPRIGKFNKDGTANAIPGHNLPMGILGTIILFFGWFGFNPGSALGFTGPFRNLAIIAAVNTLLAGAIGGIVAMLVMWWFGPGKKPDPAMSVNGVLAGLVAITAPCAFVDTWAAVVIGAVAGVLVVLATFALERMKIDDPVGAAPVHMINGMWGVLAVGIFANGNPDTAAWNGVPTAVTGLLYGNPNQLLAQVIEVAAIFVTVFVVGFVFFKVVNAIGWLRSRPEDELAGLDLPEMGAPGYTTDDVVMHGGRPGGRFKGSTSALRATSGATLMR